MTPRGWTEETNQSPWQSLFSNPKVVWTKEFSDSIVNFKVRGKCLAISTKTKDEKSLFFKDIEKDKEWVINAKEFPYYYYYLIGEDEPKLLAEDIRHEAIFITHVFDREGKHLFKLDTGGKIMASPTGKHYYSKHNMTSATMLQVYDSLGQPLWEAPTSNGDWFSEALSDSELIYIDGTDFILYNFETGEHIWNLQSFMKHYSRIVVSRNGKDYIIFDSYEIFSLNRIDEIKWIKSHFGRLYAVALSKDGKYVAVFSQNMKDKTKSTLYLLNNEDNGKTLWQIEVDENSWSGDFEKLTFCDSFIVLMPDDVAYFYKTGVKEKMKTYLYKIDNDGKLVSSYTLPGAVQLVTNGKVVTGFFLVSESSGKKYITCIQEIP